MASDHRSLLPDRHRVPFSSDASPSAADHPSALSSSLEGSASHTVATPTANARGALSHDLLSRLRSSNNSSTTSLDLDSDNGVPSTPPPPTQRPPRHRANKPPPSSATSISSKPILVRTYSGSKANGSINGAAIHVQSNDPVIGNGPVEPIMTSTRLPPVEAFSFDGILRAVEPEIRDALDAIAEICARSRLSLADEYSAHLPPQGEIVANPSIIQGRTVLWRRFAEHGRTLTAVPEASSSSERLAAESRAASSIASAKSKPTAYASLMNIMIRKGKGKSGSDSDGTLTAGDHHEILDVSENPSMALMASPTTGKNLVLESPVRVEATLPREEIWPRPRRISLWTPWSWGSRRSEPRSGPSAESTLKELLEASSDKTKPADGCG